MSEERNNAPSATRKFFGRDLDNQPAIVQTAAQRISDNFRFEKNWAVIINGFLSIPVGALSGPWMMDSPAKNNAPGSEALMALRMITGLAPIFYCAFSLFKMFHGHMDKIPSFGSVATYIVLALWNLILPIVMLTLTIDQEECMVKLIHDSDKDKAMSNARTNCTTLKNTAIAHIVFGTLYVCFASFMLSLRVKSNKEEKKAATDIEVAV